MGQITAIQGDSFANAVCCPFFWTQTEFTTMLHLLLSSFDGPLRQVCRGAGFPIPPALLSVGLSPHLAQSIRLAGLFLEAKKS